MPTLLSGQNFSFQDSNTSGIPTSNLSQQPQQASTLSWCSGAHHSRQGGIVTTTKNDPPPLVLRQFQPGTKLGPIGHTISLWPIWPLLILYGILGISLSLGLLWPQSSLMASGHILPSLASLANSSISPTPRSLSLFWAWGCLFKS
ncbi:hypothetical protein O181_108340 [Austropuccinia psidii MF-1]|uniref:Uncharacterized protein n=1 Tax=Austropuccinia psidii MF-1 TaxID=1389203 RepID=A0A9Q3PPH5_9BASI|nr:hypothetical protein [Austropuccinia psidii MF-1]